MQFYEFMVDLIDGNLQHVEKERLVNDCYRLGEFSSICKMPFKEYVVMVLEDTLGCDVVTGQYALIVSYILLERLLTKENKVVVTSYEKHKLLSVCLLVVLKLICDYNGPLNSHHSRISGIPLKELNNLESVFCKYMRYNLHVSNEEFKEIYMELKSLYKINYCC